MNNKRIRLLLFPCLFLIMLISVYLSNMHLFFPDSESLIYIYTRNALRGNIGTGYPEKIVRKPLNYSIEIGDLLLGGWENCAYGRYSHAGIYIGDNNVLEAYADCGVSIHSLQHYLDYPHLCILRVRTTPEVKIKAVNYAMHYNGKMFYPLAFKNSERFWNCTKLIWKAFEKQGIDLDINKDLWIAPESFRQSPCVDVLYERGD